MKALFHSLENRSKTNNELVLSVKQPLEITVIDKKNDIAKRVGTTNNYWGSNNKLEGYYKTKINT